MCLLEGEGSGLLVALVAEMASRMHPEAVRGSASCCHSLELAQCQESTNFNSRLFNAGQTTASRSVSALNIQRVMVGIAQRTSGLALPVGYLSLYA